MAINFHDGTSALPSDMGLLNFSIWTQKEYIATCHHRKHIYIYMHSQYK